MKLLVIAASLLATPSALAACATHLPLEGTVIVPTCDSQTEGCKPASQLLSEYADVADDDPSVLTVSVQTSPWRIYDPRMRIVSSAEFAAMLRPHLKQGVERVEMQGSWSGVAPEPGRPSLAQGVSAALDGFPVDGLDGFAWFKPDGSYRTSRQAFSGWKGGAYHAKQGEDVMSALTVGWFTTFQDRFVADKDAEGLLRAAVGWDVFSLCPDRSLEAFELAAEAGSAIGAYNAAMIRLERKAEGDIESARTLLQRAASLGDEKAAALLQKL